MNLNRAALDRLLERARRDVDSGLLPAAQLALAYQGEVVVAEAFGACSNDSRFHMYSAVKPAVSLTALELAADGSYDLAAPVAEVLPDFAGNGKESITVSQVLLHAGGFPHAPLSPRAWQDRDKRLAAYSTWRTSWEPGTRFEYHTTTAHWVLADIITELTGRHHAELVSERVLDPVGCPGWLAIAEDEQADVVDVVSVGTARDPLEVARLLGLSELPYSDVTDEVLVLFNKPAVRAAGNPGGGGIASAGDLAMWYQAVLHNSDGFLRPEVRADAMTVRQSHPDWLGVPVNRSHAFVLAGNDGKEKLRGHGQSAHPLAFGHGGAKGQIGWADPGTGMSFAYFTSGLDLDDLAQARRSVALSSKALACAGTA